MQATPCVSSPNAGAMGVHFAMPSRIGDGILDPEQPEMLIYEPQVGGGWRLVGVEFIELAEVWDSQNTGQPELEGHLMNFVGSPNRYRLPPSTSCTSGAGSPIRTAALRTSIRRSAARDSRAIEDPPLRCAGLRCTGAATFFADQKVSGGEA